jgi:NAD(P)H dehydrogenase (quinone)
MTTPPAERPAHHNRVLQRPGNVHGLARAVAEGAASVGVEVRLRHFAELLISAKPYWGRHCSELEHAPDGRLEDIKWADGITFGTPTWFGNVSAQPKLFLKKAEARAEAFELLPAA